MIFSKQLVNLELTNCLEKIPSTFGLPHSQIIINKRQQQSKHKKRGIKAGFCIFSKQAKSFAGNLDTRKSKLVSLSCWAHVDRLTMFGMKKKIGANLWKEKHCENR